MVMNERVYTPSGGPPEGGTHTQTKTTQHTHSLLQVQNRIPQALPPPATEKHRFPSPSPSSYNRWQYAWSTNRSTTPSASRGGPHRNRTHAAPCAAALAHTPNRSWHSAAPSSPSSHDRGARRITARQRRHVACSGRSWSRCNCSSALPTSHSRPTPVPVPALRSTSTACVHSAPSRAPTQRSVPDAGANVRSPSPPCSADSHAPQTRPTAPCPGAAASAGRGASMG